MPARSRQRLLITAAALLLPGTLLGAPVTFTETDLVTSATDPALVNPWGISFGPTTPFWLADNGSGLSTLYDGAGTKQNLVVTIPPPPGSPPGTQGTPTGTVFNPVGTDFGGDRFLFATEGGTIAGWQGALGTTAATRVNLSFAGASYTGLAILGSRIYAANFGQATIDVFDSTYTQVLGLSFTDPNLPAGYAPFNIQALGGALYVAYAKVQAGGGDEEAGAGFGFVDKYDANGALLQRIVTGVPGDPTSPLNAPWGLALAPAGFGDFGNDLLVGNFGDGRINAFDPVTGLFVDALRNSAQDAIVIDGLWALAFGNSGPGFDPAALYFTAGPNGETGGVFGRLTANGTAPAAPEPAAILLVSGGLAATLAQRRRTIR